MKFTSFQQRLFLALSFFKECRLVYGEALPPSNFSSQEVEKPVAEQYLDGQQVEKLQEVSGVSNKLKLAVAAVVEDIEA